MSLFKNKKASEPMIAITIKKIVVDGPHTDEGITFALPVTSSDPLQDGISVALNLANYLQSVATVTYKEV